MARNEIYDGPISESIPSSVVSFSHRRNRNDSTASFTYFQEDQDHLDWPDEVAIGAESDVDHLSDIDPNESIRSSKRPSLSRDSVEEPLLRRSLSASSHHHYYRDDQRDQWNQFSTHAVHTEEYGRPLSTVFSSNYNSYDEDNDPTISRLRYIDYRYLRLVYHPANDNFRLLSGWKDPFWKNAKGMRAGLDADDRDSREQVFGKNLIDIQQKSILHLLMDETMNRLRHISLFECDIRVLRNGFWRSVPSRELVPGDVYEFSDPSLNYVPCDCILLSGDCIVNESESVPVSKVPLTDDALKYLDLSAPSIHPALAKHFLFSGTKVIRARRPQGVDDDEAIALAVVVRTGFLTTKGALVRSMLFPKPSGFSFYRDSFRYISVMAIIAVLGFVASFVNFIRLGLSWHLIIVRALDLITIVVPPALPATLSIGTNFALSRLKAHKIYCISPQRVNVGGKLDVICFDKTGTLTEDGLDVLGVRIVDHNRGFSKLLPKMCLAYSTSSDTDSIRDRSRYNNTLYTMATCHSLRVIDGELLGDPLDVKMFQFTGWSFEEGGSHTEQADSETILPSIARPPLGESHTSAYQRNNLEVGYAIR
ncbi:hypothetical protein AbraIFM66951_006106 [Aspergillus brasiliensis]|nr:hypothetical protein AbraIFM66951_006106 [Aspergillus brasiliensis]